MNKRPTLLAVFAMLAIAVIPMTHSTLAQSAPRRIEVTAARFAFTPAEITIKKGEPVVLVVKSVDAAHGLRFRELNVELKIDKGGTAEARITPDKTGDFVGHCSVFCGSGHGGMALTLHVVE